MYNNDNYTFYNDSDNDSDNQDETIHGQQNQHKHRQELKQAENHDNFRVGNRLSVEFMDIMVITILTLPGVACIYYGQEIGMVDHNVRPDQIRDPNNDGHNPPTTRDLERLPMQWDDSLNAGFTSKAVPWLPVNPDFWRVNVKAQKNQPNSRYNLYKTLSKLRQTQTLKYGNFKSYLVSSWVYAFSRSLSGEPKIITILNLGTETELFHLHHSIPNLPPFVKVLAASLNAYYKPGQNTDYNDAKQSIILVIINTGSESEMLHLHTSIPHLPPYLKVIAASMSAGYELG
ncbi:hypothetical protein V9T40_000133 [Parthenolecanium corni]|uniref:Glycosyl hydrolase family 13 catalytic domain-containing protein n=1 Tax=Parthenolecanium corni TaxID=536013 RepID=A0AAN9TE19_9HEMI